MIYVWDFNRRQMAFVEVGSEMVANGTERTLISMEVESGAAIAIALREGHGPSQNARRLYVREHSSVEGGERRRERRISHELSSLHLRGSDGVMLG